MSETSTEQWPPGTRFSYTETNPDLHNPYHRGDLDHHTRRGTIVGPDRVMPDAFMWVRWDGLAEPARYHVTRLKNWQRLDDPTGSVCSTGPMRGATP